MGENAKRLFFVYNPHSGRGNIRSKLFDIVQVFSEAGYEITIYPTREAKDATRKIEHLSDQYDLVVCSGGDGTLDEVVEGMMHRQKKLPLGYIPSGTVNDFARSLKIPRDMVKAARLAVSGKDFLSDVGTFNNSHFVYIAAFGIFTDVAYSTPQDMKNVLGNMAYLLEGVKRLANIPSYHLKFSSEECSGEGDFIFGMVTNSRSVGGFKSIIGKNARVFGIVLNHRNVENETEKVQAFSEKIGVPIVGEVPRSDEIIHWEEQGKTVIEGDPTSRISKCFFDLAALLWKEEEGA